MQYKYEQQPIIVKFEDQHFDHYVGGNEIGTTVYCNIGIDANGQRWFFYTQHHMDHKSRMISIGSDYGFRKL